MFIHLHVHSAFSLLDGAFSIPQLLFRARDLGISQIALTDTNGLYAAITFYKFARQLGIKPIIGCCLQSDDGTAILLAKNKEGFRQISQMVTARHLVEHFSLRKDLKKIAYTSDPQCFVLTQDETLLQDLATCWERNHLYAELIRDRRPGQERRIRSLCNLADRLRIGVVATNNVHFLYPQDFFVHRIFTAVREQSHIHATLPCYSEDCFLKTTEEMESLFRDIPEAVRNTRTIAEQCNLEFEIGKFTFPDFPVPQEDTADTMLERLCRKGLQKRYETSSAMAEQRLQRELEVIRRLGFASYFLVVWDILRFARKRNIHWVGRGSAANSIVSYTLGITNVDPIRYDLFFERFLNPERKSPPDIDVDFGWTQRDEVLAYVYDRHGHDRVAMICTYVTFTTRLAVREIGKAMGIPETEITAVSSRIPHGAVADALLQDHTQFPETAGLPLKQEPYPSILKLAAHINGFPRHLSIHPGGIVIAPYPITEMVPLERATKGLIVTQYDMYGVEDIGLVKIDLLAQRSLSVLDDVLAMLRNRNITLDHIYNYDAVFADIDVQEMIRTGNTMGCFYIESPSMRGLQQKLNVTSFEDLTAASSVIRPGVAESGMMQQYIRRKTGEEEITYLHPRMETLLKETCGVMIYQEDVIRVAHEIAGMSLGEADLLRRAMSGKERSPLAMDELERQFLQKAISNQVQEDVAREIWRQIASFAAYAFCKAHSASFAQLSFQVAYLRTHYPAEFMAAVLTNQGGYYSTMAYVEEARRMGLRILLPDIQKGAMDYSAEGSCAVRVGLMQIKDIQARHWDSFLEQRNRRPWLDFVDFLTRTEFRERELENLIKCGACDSFGWNRPQLLWMMKALFPSKKNLEQKYGNAAFPYSENLAPLLQAPFVPRLRNYTVEEKLYWEMKLMDVAVSKHPLYYFKPWKQIRGYIPAKLLSDYKGQTVQVIGWHVTSKPASTKKNERMMFVSFEDTDCIFETTFFPQAYQQYASLFNGRGPYLIRGKVEEDHGVFTINVSSLKRVGR